MDSREVNGGKRNTNYCCVPQCTQYVGGAVSSHLFPKNPSLKAKWESALRMGKPASATMRVCSGHFLPNDYFPNSKVKHKLFPSAIPTQNIPVRTHDIQESSTRKSQKFSRQERARQRNERGSHVLDETCSENTEDNLTVSNEAADTSNMPVIPFVCYVAVQANFADSRKVRPQDTRGLADILTDTSSEEKCCHVNFLPDWTDNVTGPSLTLCNLISNNIDVKTIVKHCMKTSWLYFKILT